MVKNVAGYDLSKLVTGAFGTLGVIISATFRLHPLPKHTQTVTATVPDLGAMQLLLSKILDAQLVPAAVQVRVGAGAPQIDVLFEGTYRAQTLSKRRMSSLYELWMTPA